MKTPNLCVRANTNYDSKTKLLFEELEVWKSVEEGTGRLGTKQCFHIKLREFPSFDLVFLIKNL